jgi:tyrosine-protein kinase Etk/Wzc
LTKQYELAKLDEARDAVVIQVVDRAVPPEKKAKPKRSLMIIVAIFSGFFVSIFLAFLMEYKEKASSDPENKERIDMLRRYLRFRSR